MRRFLSLFLLMMMAAGCSGRPQADKPIPAVAPAPAPAPASQAPDLSQVARPTDLPLDDLVAGLQRYLNEGKKLPDLYERWQLKPGPVMEPGAPLFYEVDLNGDGAKETVTALNGKAPSLTGKGALLVIYQQNGQYAIDRSDAPDFQGAAVHGVADLTGDGRPEIIWSSTMVGAHTAHSAVHVSQWEPGRLTQLPGAMGIASLKLEIAPPELRLHGGIIHSVGAGGLQRERTDTYRFINGEFRLTDRRYAPSELGYHRLQDGILAESFGRFDEARKAYQEAMGPGRELPAGIDQAGADEAVRAMARFRLGALLIQHGQPAEARRVLEGATGPYAGLSRAAALDAGSREAACKAAEAWARENPAFLEALNSPYGYANPRWQAADLCGPLPLT